MRNNIDLNPLVAVAVLNKVEEERGGLGWEFWWNSGFQPLFCPFFPKKFPIPIGTRVPAILFLYSELYSCHIFSVEFFRKNFPAFYTIFDPEALTLSDVNSI